MAEVTLGQGQSVSAKVEAFDAAGLTTTNFGQYLAPTLVASDPNSLLITQVDTMSWNLSLPSKPVPGTITVTATMTPQDPTLPTLQATGTVTISVHPGTVTSIALTFGTPTPSA